MAMSIAAAEALRTSGFEVQEAETQIFHLPEEKKTQGFCVPNMDLECALPEKMAILKGSNMIQSPGMA